MKEKNVAGILALFLGGFGVHRFYLGQTGLGVFYLIFCWLPLIWILGLIDAIVFFSMDKEAFDLKYNRNQYHLTRKKDTDFDRHQRYREERERRRRETRGGRREERRQERFEPRQRRPQQQRPQPRSRPVPKSNPYKNSGIRKYKEFDYDGAIADFEKALEIDEKDVAVHFNIACAYSLNENVDRAFHHLDRAVALGFNDFKRIKEHDALAYIRIQDKFDEFEENGFRLTMQLDAPKQDLLDTTPSTSGGESTDLLEQLKKLGELREKGLLTEEEFVAQKKRLLE